MDNLNNQSCPTLTSADFFRPDEDVFIHKCTQCPEFVGVMHSHKFIEIVYVISGKATHRVGDKSYNVHKGDLIVINFDTSHAFFAEEDSEPFDAYDLMFTPNFFKASAINGGDFETLSTSFLFYSLFPGNKPLGPDLRLSERSYAEFGSIFDKIYNEYTAREKGHIELIRSYTIELIIKMFRKMEKGEKPKISARQQALIDSTLGYLRENFKMQITAEELAGRIFLSKDYFGKLFKNVTNMPVSVFLQKTRIEEACKMLVSTDRKIGDIAEDCGFNDIKFFYTVFKKQVGTTPAKFRENSKQ
ncbi:MAG: helix-turn-helix domain-containing protein [Clostridia bacterium]|nr:helix-turn-helix domain-containing protein [Clostridia bacterium]MBR3576064.1 helix-turn-helix domain-containing protein [Clostridia bacterium]